MIRFNDISYQKIKNAKLTSNHIIVSFENGDVIEVSKDILTPYDVSDIKWDQLTFSPFEITIPAKPNSLDIPWDKLRVITDKEFAKYLAERAEEQSKLIGIKIKRLREKKGFKSNDLAERAGVTPQTISRIEQGRTDIGFVTLRKILASMGYTLKDLANEEALVDMESSKRTYNYLIRRLSSAGVDSKLLTKRIIPQKLQKNISTHKENLPSMLLDEITSYISSVYGWTRNEIWGNEQLSIKTNPSELAYFKKPSNANENQIKAYCHYAYYLSKIVLKTANVSPKSTDDYPESLEDFKANYFKENQIFDLKTLLEFVWDLGISVLPLNDPGVFHGASWNIEGKHVIVLKQVSKSHAKWTFDLLHELYHVFAHLQKNNSSVVEVEELNPFSDNESVEELEANAFANQFIFGQKAEILAEQCVEVANWKLENLKNAVAKVSKKENVREDFMANYMAYRLSYQGQDWWSTASKMQVADPEPFIIASEILKKRLQLQKLNPIEHNLLTTAISN